MKIIMINVCLTQPAPWPYACDASAKSEDQRANWLRAGIAAMRHFLCPKKVFALCSMGGYVREASACRTLTGLQPAFIRPPQPQVL
jgi:hypothetical protein